jgi:hypothetical protein
MDNEINVPVIETDYTYIYFFVVVGMLLIFIVCKKVNNTKIRYNLRLDKIKKSPLIDFSSDYRGGSIQTIYINVFNSPKIINGSNPESLNIEYIYLVDSSGHIQHWTKDNWKIIDGGSVDGYTICLELNKSIKLKEIIIRTGFAEYPGYSICVKGYDNYNNITLNGVYKIQSSYENYIQI